MYGDKIEGLGIPGTPAGGVLTVQGDAAATPVIVTGSDGNDANFAAVATGAILTRDSMYVWDAASALWVRARSTPNGVQWQQSRPAVNSVNVAGAANAITTLTIPAPAGATQHIYICHLRIARVATAALAGGALLTVTTTNLVGGKQWRTGNQASITVSTFNDSVLIDHDYSHPLRSLNPNVAVTIVAPAAGAAVSWDIAADYYIDEGQP